MSAAEAAPAPRPLCTGHKDRRAPCACDRACRCKGAHRVCLLGSDVYWLTRDTADPEDDPNTIVDVWSSEPKRVPLEGRGVLWLDEHFGAGALVVSLSLASARLVFGTVPDDDRMVIRIGNPAAAAPEVAS